VRVLKEHGIPYEEHQDYAGNPHWRAAAIRWFINVQAVTQFVKRFAPARVVSAWGGNREYHILRDYIHDVQVYRPIIVAADSIRDYDALPTVPAIPNGTPLFLHDVYRGGDVSLYDFLSQSTAPQVCLIRKRLDGLFGDVYDEGCWYRPRPKAVVYFADSLSQPWEHDPLDWLNVGMINENLTWTAWKSWGVEEIVFVTPHGQQTAPEPDVPELGVVSLPAPPQSAVGRFAFRLASSLLPTSAWRFLVDRLCPLERYDARFLAALRQYLAGRKLTSFSWQGLLRKANEYMSHYPIFSAQFPLQSTVEVVRHASAAWFHDVTLQGYFLEGMGTYANQSATYNAMFDNVAQQSESRIPWKAILTVAAALITFLVLRRSYYRGVTILSSLIVHASRLLPVVGTAASAAIQHLHDGVRVVRGLCSLSRWVTPSWNDRLAAEYLRWPATQLPTPGLSSGVDPALAFKTIMQIRKMPGCSPLTAMNLGGFLGCEVLEEVAAELGGPVVQLGLIGAEWVKHGWRTAACIAALRPLPFWLRLPVHLCANAWVHYCENRSYRWDEFVTAAHTGPWSERSVDRVACQATAFPLSRGWLPRESRPHYVRKELCHHLVPRADEGIEKDTAVRGSPTLYYMPTGVPLYTPSNNGAMFHAALYGRILAAPPNRLGQQENLSRERLFLAIDWTPIERTPELVEAYLSHWDSPVKVRMMRGVNKQFESSCPQPGDKPTDRIELMVKLDEHLVKPDLTMKPRMIANVNPVVQVAVGPQIRLASARLHEEWTLRREEPVLTRAGVDYYIVYGVGLTDVEIGNTLTFSISRDNSVVIVVVGDDSVVFCNINGHWWCYENDFSQYDQSQDRPALELTWAYLEHLGVSSDDVEWLRRTSRAPYVWTSKHTGQRISVSRHERTMRDTGGPDTSLGNSILNAHLWMLVLTGTEILTPEQLTARFLSYGMGAKAHVFTSWHKVGFLKGKWFTYRDGHVWAPCPSRFLKMGKIVGDPRTTLHPDLPDAVLDFAAGLASTYHAYSQVPLIRAFVKRFYVPGHATAGRQLEKMVVGTGVELMDPLREAALYYDISPDMFLEAESAIRASPIPAFFEHPVYWVLAERDYA